MIGKAQKVFTELVLKDSTDFNIVKEHLLSAFEVVPEVDRNALDPYMRTTPKYKQRYIFKRWQETREADYEIEQMRETILLEQFNETIESTLKNWLIDHKPEKNK